jgi:hypothetical protein
MGRLSDSLLIDHGLFAPTSRMADPDTARAAGNAHPSLRANDRHAALLAHAANPAGLSDFELADIMGRQQTSAGKRRGELRDLGFIEDSGLRRDSPSGSSAIVWRITSLGKLAI